MRLVDGKENCLSVKCLLGEEVDIEAADWTRLSAHLSLLAGVAVALVDRWLVGIYQDVIGTV